MMSGILKAQLDAANKKYSGNLIPNFLSTYFQEFHIKGSLYRNLNINFYFLDLPPDTPMLDLSKIAGMDLSKLPGVEQSGERCIWNIQEWLLHEVSWSETAILPEDKLQHILVGVCKFLFLLLVLLQTQVR